MRLTIPKNRIVPLYLFALAGTIISLIIGMYYMNRTVQDSYDEAIKNYDVISDKTAEMLLKGIEDKYEALKLTALLIGQAGDISKEYITEILPVLAQEKMMADMAIVTLDGKGYDIFGGQVDVSKDKFFESVQTGQVKVTVLEPDANNGQAAMVYAAPISNEEGHLGYLIAKDGSRLNDIVNFDSGYTENSEIFILNEDNELISSLNASKAEGFHYGQVIMDGFLHDDYSNHKANFKLSNYFKPDKTDNNVVVWYQKPLGLNNWSVLIGKSNILNHVTQNIIRITNVMWFIIFTSIVILFLMLIIYQRRSNNKLIQMLYLDPVTGGDNWYKFRIDVNKILNSRLFLKKRFALVNFDINRFKIINDSLGHQKGDEVLKDIYNIIRKWVKPGEPFTRYSADQFYILLNFQQEEEVTERIRDLNNRLHGLKLTKTVKFYFGVYYITERKDSIDRMGEFAGIAKHRIKGSNEGIISYFDDTARARLLEEEKIEKNMHEALKNNEFIVYLQPKYTTIEETLSGAEALVRWSNGSGNLVSPGFFIPLFEKNGFITELDLYMLRKVCKIQKGWLDKGYRPIPVSVNISRVHFANPHLADIIKDIVDEYQVPHELIELELSESAFLQNKKVLISTVILLREYGFSISMDDFGAGYSSLNSLKDLPLDVVKLDGEMFRITKEVERGHTVIRNTISMAKDLHMKVVAECIETREQVDFLCTVGCDIIQGYYYAKPMPVEQFEARYLTERI